MSYQLRKFQAQLPRKLFPIVFSRCGRSEGSFAPEIGAYHLSFLFPAMSWWIYSSRQNTHKNLRENELTVTLVQLQLSLAPAELANTRERSCTCSSAAVLAAPEKRSVWRPLPSLASLGILRQQHTMVFYIFLFTILNFWFSLSPCFYGKKNNILRRQNEWA